MLCIAGKNNIAVEITKYALNFYSKNEICCITNKNDIGEDNFQRSFLKYAIDNNLNITTLEQVYGIKNLIFLSLEFDRIIKPNLFKTNNIYNIHFSLLPKYKGMYTSYWPLRNGEDISGVSLHRIDDGIDTGDIISQMSFKINPGMNSKELYLKYIEKGIQLIKENFKSIINNSCKSKKQDYRYSSYYSKNSFDYNNITIDLNQTAFNIKNQIRALNFRDYQLPYINNNRITHVLITNEKSKVRPGEIIEKNDLYFKLATIDYNILVYKDKFDDMIKYCSDGDKNKLKILINNNYNINEQNNKGWTPLIVACYNGQLEIVDLLLKSGAEINKTNYNGTTPLMYAKDYCVKNNNYDLVNHLLRYGANISIKDNKNRDIFDYILKDYGSYELVKFKEKIREMDNNQEGEKNA